MVSTLRQWRRFLSQKAVPARVGSRLQNFGSYCGCSCSWPPVNEKRNGFSLPFKVTAGAFFGFCDPSRWSLTSLTAGSPTMGNFAEPYRSRGYEWARDESRAHVDMDWVRALRDSWTGSIIVKGVCLLKTH